MSTDRGRWWWCLGGIVCASLVLDLALVDGRMHSWSGDMYQYVLHAKAIVEGRPYVDTGYLYNPRAAEVGPPSYPPGTSLLLAPLVALFGQEGLLPLRLLMVLCSVAALVAYGVLARQELGGGKALVAVAAVALSGSYIRGSGSFTSDVPFFLDQILLFLAFAAMARAPRATVSGYAALFVTALMLPLFRTVGYVVLVGLGLYSVLASRFRRWGAAVCLAAAAVAAFSICRTLGIGEGAYLEQVETAGFLVTLKEKIYAYFLGLGQLVGYVEFGTFEVPPVNDAAHVVIPLLIAGGFIARLISRRIRYYDVAFLFYTGTLVVWPGGQAERFLKPLLPLFVFYVLDGILLLSWLRRPRPALGKALAVGAAAAVALFYVVANALTVADSLAHRRADIRSQPDSRDLIDWVTSSTSGEAQLMFRQPRTLTYLTGRSGTASFEGTPEEILAYLEGKRIDYVVVQQNVLEDEWESRPVEKTLEVYPERFRRVFGNDHFQVYEVLTE